MTPYATESSQLLSRSGPITPITDGYSQRAVQVAPDARHLLYVVPPEDRRYLPLPDEDDLLTQGGSSLILRDEFGNERTLTSGNLGDFRFSPDSSWVAAFSNSELWLFSVSHPQSERLLTFDSPTWLEWNAMGIAVLDRRASDNVSVVDLVDLRGTVLAHVILPEHPLTRITTAANTDRVVMFTQPARGNDLGLILEIYARSPHVPPRVIGQFRDGPVLNAEMAPDGTEFAFATRSETFLVRGENPRKRIQWLKSAHSIWYTPNGDLVAADPKTAVLFHDKRVWSVQAKSGSIQTLRLRRDAQGFVFVEGNRVRSWNPMANSTRTIGQVASTRHLISADSYAGGLVFWTTQKHGFRGRGKRAYQKSF